MTELKPDFAPCPLCKQYSHSLSEGQVAEAFMHFQSMYAHPVRGHPMGDNFDDKTRDAAQVLMAAAQSAERDTVLVQQLAEELKQFCDHELNAFSFARLWMNYCDLKSNSPSLIEEG